MIAADNIRITNPVVDAALSDLDPRPIQVLAEKCESAGAEAIDINSGPLNRDPERKMAFLVEVIQDVTGLPILLDTANPSALEAGLRVCRNRVIVNGFSLEPAKLASILPLAKKYEAHIIGYLLYPDSHVPSDGAERLGVAIELFDKYIQAGLDKERLIIDPVISPLMWQDGNAQDMEILSVIRMLPDVLGFDVRTIAGLSNLTSGQGDRGKKILMEKIYLPMLMGSGLSIALMDVTHVETIQVARACRSLMSPGIFSWEEI